MNEYAYGWQIPQRVEKFRLNITYGVRTIYISSQSMIACYLKLLELGSVNKQKDPFYFKICLRTLHVSVLRREQFWIEKLEENCEIEEMDNVPGQIFVRIFGSPIKAIVFIILWILLTLGLFVSLCLRHLCQAFNFQSNSAGVQGTLFSLFEISSLLEVYPWRCSSIRRDSWRQWSFLEFSWDFQQIYRNQPFYFNGKCV